MHKHLNKYERIQFYRERPAFKKAMVKFMDVEEGIRCIAMRPDPKISPKIPYVYKNVHKPGYALRTLDNDNFNEIVGYARTVQYLTYIYDEDIQNCKSMAEIYSHIIGLTPVIDIDAPDIDPLDASKGRYDIMLPENKIYFGQILGFINKLEEVLIEQDELFKIMFSGNGFQFMLDNYYPETSHDLADINNFREKILELIDDVVQMTKYEFVHTKKYNWNNNMKIPYTFHFDIPNRLTRPITLQQIRDRYNK